MLKTKKTTRRKWPLIVPLIAILLLVLVVGIFYVHSNKQNPQASSQSPDQSIKGPSKANADTPQKQQGDKQRVAMPDPNVDSSKSTDKVPVSPTMSASITLLEHKNSSVTYAFKITNAGASGICSAEFTSPEGKPVTRSYQTLSDTCGPTTIPDIEFDAYGRWLATFRYYSNNNQVVTSKNLEILR